MTHTRKQLGRLFLDITEMLARRGVDVDGWHLSTWSPGDGWTRYRVESDDGSRHPVGSSYRSLHDMWAFLYGMREGLCLLP